MTSWTSLRAILGEEALPAALVDLDALDRNVDRIRAHLVGSRKTLRLASKSVRHVGLLRRILARGGDAFSGLMTFSLEETVRLREEGFDDLLVAYPSVQASRLRSVAREVAKGAKIRLVADTEEHLIAYGEAAREAETEIDVLLELDVAYRPAGLHLGVLRSPLRNSRQLLALAQRVRAIQGVRMRGIMAYEAHVAGLPDATPFSRALNPARRALKRRAIPAVAALRAEAVRCLTEAGFDCEVVNGGGTGSLNSTVTEACVTEVTAGSGFLCPHLFDYYRNTDLEPAALFALEACRIPEPGVVTCLGGGYVASGEPGWDRLPIPYRPRGLRYVSMEGAGEVQTPLRYAGEAPEVGAPIFFRHAKAGELAERFAEYLLVRDGQIEAREPTYRGSGWCFF